MLVVDYVIRVNDWVEEMIDLENRPISIHIMDYGSILIFLIGIKIGGLQQQLKNCIIKGRKKQ